MRRVIGTMVAAAMILALPMQPAAQAGSQSKIKVKTPDGGETVHSAVKVKGVTDFRKVHIMVLNQRLKVIGEAGAENTCGNCEGSFKAKVEYSVNKTRNGSVKACHQDSDRTYCDDVAVTLKP